MSNDTELGNGTIEPLDRDMYSEMYKMMQRALRISENLSGALLRLSASQATEKSSADTASVSFVGGTDREILSSLLEALKFNGIEKKEGRGWVVRVGFDLPREFTLLRDAIGHRIERGYPSAAAVTLCEWVLSDDDFCTYRSACGNVWQFNDDGPVENGMKFCCYCGNPMNSRPAREVPSDA